MICPACENGETIKKKVKYYYDDDLYLGRFEADVCTKCEEIIFTNEESKRIDEIASKFGLMISHDFGDSNIKDFQILSSSEFPKEIPHLSTMRKYPRIRFPKNITDKGSSIQNLQI